MTESNDGGEKGEEDDLEGAENVLRKIGRPWYPVSNRAPLRGDDVRRTIH